MPMRPLLLALVICVLAAGFEGLMAGAGVKQRFAELRMPPGSPNLPVWIAIGGLYYAMCFVVLYRLFAGGMTTADADVAFVLAVAVMIYNGVWNALFFRLKNLKVAFLSFIPYAALILALAIELARIDEWSAAAVAPYLAYLIYATWWGFRIWQLNKL